MNEQERRNMDAACEGTGFCPRVGVMSKTNNLNQILTERGDRYGRFVDHAKISQELKRLIYRQLDARKQDLDDDQLEALEMICHKVARIINGDPDYSDSWRDVAGSRRALVSTIPAGRPDLGEVLAQLAEAGFDDAILFADRHDDDELTRLRNLLP